ncbi:MAG: hypothetical protein P8R43_00860, partial [Planctomycetota bacterium]|nr:hypothetical protein [Planctomycetota bacterium]
MSRPETLPGGPLWNRTAVFGSKATDSDIETMSIPAIAMLVSLGSAVAGALLAFAVAEHRNRRERASLAKEMTRQVRERYEVYVQMEDRVQRVISEFDRSETALRTRLSEQTRQMRRLQKALDAHEGISTKFAEKAPVESPEFPLEETGPREVAQFQDDVAAWRGRIHEATREKEVELERQTTVIDELTARIESLRPLEGQLGETSNRLDATQGEARRLRDELSGAEQALEEARE